MTGLISEDELNLISGITEGSVDVNPSCPDLDKLWQNLTQCLMLHRKAEESSLKLRRVIGKLLLIARDNPEVYQSRNFKTYEDFISRFVVDQMGLSRASLYSARFVEEKLSKLTPSEYEEIGSTKANILASACNSNDSNYPVFLEKAKEEGTAREFKAWVEEQGLIAKGEMDYKVISINTNQEIHSMWNDFVSTPEVQAYCGTSNPAEILRAMIRECSSWIADGAVQ